MIWKTVGLFLLTSGLCASDIEERLERLELQAKTSSQDLSHSRVDFEQGWMGLQSYASPIYWRAKIGGAEWVYKWAFEKLGFDQKGESTRSFDWDLGYRIGANVRLPILNWEVVGTYTHFETSEKKALSPFSLFMHLGGHTNSKPHFQHTLEYDTALLKLRANSLLSRLIGIGGALGVKKSWVVQENKGTFSPQGISSFEVKDRSTFEGIGPYVGLELKWSLFKGLTLLASSGGVLHYGEYDAKHTEKDLALEGGTTMFAPAINVMIGIDWEYPYNWCQFFFGVAYEAEYLWTQNQSIKLDSHQKKPKTYSLQLERKADDLIFYGLTLKGGIEF